VWYCESCEQEHADFDVPERCSRCGHGKLRQDEDVLDTWFSSALWPFSTMGWPEKTPELAFFYPTSTLVTGHDILFFWVARMMMMGYEFMDDRPFDQVYLTSLVRDVKGRKLSKSLGNSPDPLQVMETYGTDALRFAMILMAPQGQDILYSNERVEVGRNFANKLWNAARFTLMHQSAQTGSSTITESDDIWDRWIRSRSAQTVTRVTGALDRHDFNAAADALYDFVWHDFCDWYLEAIKPRLYGNQGEKAKETARSSALLVLERTLRLLHPFMPFITEEIWQHIRPLLPGEEKPVSVMVAEWPADAESGVDETVESDIALVQNLVGAMREVRADFRVHPSRTMKALCQIHEPRYAELLEQTRPTVESIAGVEIHVMDGKETRPSGSASGILTGIEFYVPLAGLIDTDVEVERLTKERERITGEFEKVKARIASTQFLEKAPAEVVEKEYSKRDRYADLIVRLTRNLETLQT
jgi:valyl-tRNA synthetase